MSAPDIIRMVLSIVFVMLTLSRAWPMAMADERDTTNSWMAIILTIAGIALIVLEARP